MTAYELVIPEKDPRKIFFVTTTGGAVGLARFLQI
jgi:hypothetical protein